MCKNMLLILIFINIVVLLPLNADVLTSKYDMESQIEIEAYIIKKLEEFISAQPKKTKKLNIIKKYLNRCKHEYIIAIHDVEHYLANPINQYTLIKRHTLDLDYVENLIGDSKDYKRNKSIKLGMDDLDTAIALFLKMQMVYQLNVTQLANGILAGNYSKNRRPFKEQVTPMTASDCYLLATRNLGRNDNESNKDFTRNIAWLKEALVKIRKDANDASDVTKFDIIYQIVQMYTMMIDVDNAAKWITKLMSLVSHDPSYMATFKHEEMMKLLLDNIGKIQTSKSADPDPEMSDLEEVASHCRGDVSTVQNYSRPLTCVYAHRPHPFLMLARVKAEVLNYEPPVTMFYDVISNSEIEELQLLIKLKGHRNDVVSRISRRVKEFTGLTMESTYSQYIVDYGLGVHYARLKDASFKGKEEQKNENEKATVKFFLSNVDQGGASVFGNLPLTVFPVKGAALFWVNLLPSGEWDDRSFQAPCPVMRGNRWTITSQLYEPDSRSLCAANNGTPFTYST